MQVPEPVRLSEMDEAQLARLMNRSGEDVGEVQEQVRKIVEDVRTRGAQALVEAHQELSPGLTPGDFRVEREEIEQAYKQVPEEVTAHLRLAARNIRRFHAAQLELRSWQVEVAPGIVAGRKCVPMDAVGCYVPGMRAVYPSTALMTIIPAVVAGVERVVVCTPAGEGLRANPYTLVAADIAGATEIYKLGGPWAIAAMAFGVEPVPRVAKIVGPGNKYVTAAKTIVFGVVDIDSPAGPSEALVLADAGADARVVALDMLAQMEHDPDAAAVLVTDHEPLAYKVRDELAAVAPTLPRAEILGQAMRYCALVVAGSLEEAIDFANSYAPEHLEIIVAEPFGVLERIRNAGSIFLGPYAPVAAGDYASGTNHVLPTAAAARAFSGLSVDDFVKHPTYQYLTREGLASIAPTITTLAEAEGLPIHAMSVRARLED